MHVAQPQHGTWGQSREDKEVDMREIGGESVGKVMAVVNQKGGVGKSTTAVNLGAYLAAGGRKVLVIDVDPQGNASSGVGVDKTAVKESIYDALIEERPLSELIRHTAVPGLDVVPSNMQLAGAEVELVTTLSRELRLKKAIGPVRSLYDYILVDCPPSLGLLTVNALTAADSVLVPIQCEYYALEGLSQLLNTIQLVQKHLNPGLQIEGVVMTMFDSRTNLSQQVISEVQKFFKDRVFKTIIPRNVRLSEAPSYGQPIILYDDRSKGAEAYRQLAEEVMAHE